MTREQWVTVACALAFALMFVLGMLAEMLRRRIVEGGDKSGSRK